MPKVLLVEDDESLRILYSRSLRLKKYDVETAVNGADALVKVGIYMPDVIVLDIMMPELNGIEVLKILKSDPEFKKIPILMLTTASEINTIKECLETGATGYILKGGSPDEIAKKINNIIGPPE
ncbi:MAG: response regulator [Deltaproteobacteria bacterium]|nr:response regulator [Deltaproteobacteria bacterium]